MLVQIEVPTIIYSGKVPVIAAGTEVNLPAMIIKSVTIKALSTNTGIIYVGNSSVSNANGFQLSAGDTISIDIANLGAVWIDSSISNEGISYIAVN